MQSALDQFRISIARVRDLISIHNSWLEDEIRQQLSYKSYQQPEKIADAVNFVEQVVESIHQIL
jgi:hypothetical protein